MPDHRHRAALRAATALLGCCLLSSCLTSLLWEAEDEDDGGFEALCGKLVLTPFTLAIDLVTFAIIDALDGDDDEDHDGWASHAGSSRPVPRSSGEVRSSPTPPSEPRLVR